MNVGDVLKHYKGGEYVVIAVDGHHSETQEALISYQSLKDGRVHHRPPHMFDETVNVDGIMKKRFEKIDFRVIFLDQYQEMAWRTAPREEAAYPEMLRRIEPKELREEVMKRWDLHTWTFGLTGEAGEFADYLKKVDGHGHAEEPIKENKELGDVTWYAAAIAKVRGFSLSDIATTNIKKLMARYPNGFKKELSINRKD